MSGELIAVHESSHAVGYLRLFPTIPTPDAEVHTVPSGEIKFLPLTPQHDYEKSAIQLCCGFAGEVLAGGSVDEAEACSETDFALARERSKRTLHEVKNEAVALMSQPENLRAVAAVARELMKWKTLPLDVVRKIVRIVDQELEDEIGFAGSGEP